MSRALLPSDTAIAAWSSVVEVVSHFALPADSWKEVAAALGDESLDDLVLLAGIPEAAMRKAIEDTTGSPLEAVRLSRVYNTARAKFGM
eukprot:6477064-Amphidinium_carterae.1